MLILRFAYIEVMVRWHDACSVVDLINYALVLQQQQLNVRTDLFFFLVFFSVWDRKCRVLFLLSVCLFSKNVTGF